MLHVCRGREIHRRFWWGNLKREDHLEDLDIGAITLKLILNKQYRTACSGYGQVAVTDECSNKPLGSIKCREFLD
jgi:hypothetical protein